MGKYTISRRSMLQGIFGALFLPLLRTPPKAAAQAQGDGLLYTDSDNNTITTELSDRNLTTGISYGA